MDPQKLINILTLQRNQAMDNVALLAMERDILAEKIKELEAEIASIKGDD